MYYGLLKAVKTGAATDMFNAIMAEKLADKENVETMTGLPPLTFRSSGQPLADYTICGNTVQASAPAPGAPVAVNGVGTLEGTGQHSGKYAVPVTCGGTTTSLYIGEVQSTRYVKKLVLTGEENWTAISASGSRRRFRLTLADALPADSGNANSLCSHLPLLPEGATFSTDNGYTIAQSYIYMRLTADYDTTAGFRSFLASQYAAGTPVTVWYVLAEPETAIVNEPLHKIGNYADTVTKAQAGTDIPTVQGTNTLTVGTTVQPSNVTIVYKER